MRPFSSYRLVAVLRGDSKISGTVTFEQADENSPTTISWNITGHDPNAQRGMHIHQFGDNTNGCTSAGPHCTSLPRTRIAECSFSLYSSNDSVHVNTVNIFLYQSIRSGSRMGLLAIASATLVISVTFQLMPRAMPLVPSKTNWSS